VNDPQGETLTHVGCDDAKKLGLNIHNNGLAELNFFFSLLTHSFSLQRLTSQTDNCRTVVAQAASGALGGLAGVLRRRASNALRH